MDLDRLLDYGGCDTFTMAKVFLPELCVYIYIERDLYRVGSFYDLLSYSMESGPN